jgi:hypothetical protein
MMNNTPVGKWFQTCPLKSYFEKQKIDINWIEDYCFGDYVNCERYKLEEKGAYHPDNMMCNGTIREDLI